tara:strand:+ start:5034 stop:5723 length:690 start_codon:yes stop_codon:yes gene_type:complete
MAGVLRSINMPIFALRTTSNREDQVFDFVTSNISKKGLDVYGVVRAHGLRGYIFLEARDRESAEESYQGVPYARGLLPAPIDYAEIENMLEQVKVEVNIRKGDIVEIISGSFKRDQAKVSRVDQDKEEVVVELLEAAVPIPMTLSLDSVKVIRRDETGGGEEKKIVEEPEEERVEIRESVEEVMKESSKEESKEKKEEEKVKKTGKIKKKPVIEDVDMNLDDDEFELNV